jgi:hypothetical protein
MIKTFINKFRKNSQLGNERGQGMMEYILLVVVLVGIIVVAKPFLEDRVSGIQETLGSKIGEVLGN